MSIRYDSSILEYFAEKLNDKAMWTEISSSLAGIVFGVLFGAGLHVFLATPFGGGRQVDPMMSIGVPLVIGLIIGYSRGNSRAFLLRLEAQRTLCHVQIEKNTRPNVAAAEAPASTAASIDTPPVVPTGECSNCGAQVPRSAQSCPKCTAIFGPGSAFHIKDAGDSAVYA